MGTSMEGRLQKRGPEVRRRPKSAEPGLPRLGFGHRCCLHNRRRNSAQRHGDVPVGPMLVQIRAPGGRLEPNFAPFVPRPRTQSTRALLGIRLTAELRRTWRVGADQLSRIRIPPFPSCGAPGIVRLGGHVVTGRRTWGALPSRVAAPKQARSRDGRTKVGRIRNRSTCCPEIGRGRPKFSWDRRNR